MKISVLIPTYRNADTVVATVESVLAQRRTPHEIIVLLDGVADDTPHLLAPYADRIRIVQQENAGVAQARNRLVAEARGEMLAFLDADDLWHPDTLLAQEMALRMAPTAGAAYCGHVEFTSTPPPWPATLDAQPVELLGPREFFRRLNITSADFGSMSFCCVRKTTLARLGAEPFSRDLCGPEDCFLHYQLALQGPIVFQRTPLVAYRLRRGSLSEDRTRVLSDWTRVFVRLAGQFQHAPDRGLRADFRRFHAQKRREYAQVLLGLGATHEARHELRQSLRNCRSARSQAKSLALLAASLLPAPWQPRWPRAVRSAGPASASATVTVRGEIAPVDPAPPMPPPRAAVALLGVTRNTHNHGVRVLLSSAVEALTAHHPDLELIALDYQHEPALWNEETAAGVRPLSLVNLRFSWRVFLPNNVFTLLLLVALVRLVPSRRLRVWILSRNGTLRQLLRARVCLAFSGGDSFSDLYGLERLIYVTAPQLLALWVEVPLVQLPQTYGPFRTAPARWIARHILLRSRAVYSRDPAGPTIVAQLTRGRAPVVKVAPDWGFLLPPRPLEAAIDARLGAWAREHTVVGVNPSQLLDSGGYSGDNMFGLREDYRGLMRRLIDRLLADPTYFVLLVPHVGGEAGEAERPLCRELLAEFAPAHPGRIGFIDLPLDHRQTKHVIGRCDLFIGARMHACIAAASQGVPTLALAYSDKFTGVMAVLASEAVTVVDLRHEGLPRIESALAELDARRHELRNDLNDRMPNIRHHIVTSADTLLAA